MSDRNTPDKEKCFQRFRNTGVPTVTEMIAQSSNRYRGPLTGAF